MYPTRSKGHLGRRGDPRSPEGVSALFTIYRASRAFQAGLLSAVILLGAGTAFLPTTTVFQANDSHRVLDTSIQTNSPTVTRLESEHHSITAAVEVPPKPIVLAPLHSAPVPRIPKRATRSRRLAIGGSDLYSRPHDIYHGSNCPVGPDWVKNLAHDMSSSKFGDSQWSYLDKLWTRESQFNPWCENSSGAYGVP